MATWKHDANVQKCHFGGIYLTQSFEAEGTDLEKQPTLLGLVTRLWFCTLQNQVGFLLELRSRSKQKAVQNQIGTYFFSECE